MKKSKPAGLENNNSALCVLCGEELNDITARLISIGPDKAAYTHICIDCQQKRFDRLADATSPSLAIFYCCIAFDAPFDIQAVPDFDSVKEPWKAYCDNLRIKSLDETDEGKPAGFLDGITDITEIFGTRLTIGEFNKAIGMELSGRRKQPGTAQQREIWGLGDPDNPKDRYTTENYKELDRLYRVFSSRIDQPDLAQENILRTCAKWTLKRDKLVSKGKILDAKRLDDMIQTNLSSENLRKKDAKPIEDVRIDSIVDRLEKAGLLKKGKLASPDEIFRLLFGRPPKYSYTADAADQMIKIILNCMQSNDGLPEFEALTDDMRINDTLGEFAKEQNETEKSNYEKLGLIRMPKKQGGSDGA